MYNLLINKAINYAVLPVVAKVASALDDWWSNLSPSTRSTIYSSALRVLYPLFAAVDGLRWAVVSAYVIKPAPVWALSRQIDSKAFSSHESMNNAATAKFKESKTRYYMLPFVILLSPLFYLADMLRSIVASAKGRNIEYDLELLWQGMFGSASPPRKMH